VAARSEKIREDSKKPADPSRHLHLFAIAALCLLTLAAYFNSFGSGFVFDNQRLLLMDPRIGDFSPENIGLILRHTYWWPSYESGLYRPVATLSYLFNYAVLGDGENPAGYHWINLLLHLGNVLLVYALARRLLRGIWPAGFAAAIWAVHPVLTESVTNIAGRPDLMAGMTVLSGLLFYLKSTEASGARRWSWLSALMLVTLLGVFSKENAVVIAGVIILYELVWWRERRNARGLLWGCAAVAPPILLLLYARSRVLAGINAPTFFFVDNPLLGAGFWTARLTALKVIARDLGLMAWPAQLSGDYSYNAVPLAHGTIGDWTAWISLAAVIAALIYFRRRRAIVFAAGFAALTLLPTANLFFLIGAIMGERFLYLPAIAFAVCLVAALYSVVPRPNVVLCVIAALLAIRTWVRNPDWHDDLSFARATAQATPANYKGHALLAAALYQSRGDIDEIIAESEKSRAILEPLPDLKKDATPYQQAGQFYLTKGDTSAPRLAQQEFEKALAVLKQCESIVEADTAIENEQARARGEAPVQPVRYADLYRLLSMAELRLGDTAQALDRARYALSLTPFSAAMYLQLADALLHSGRAQESAEALMEGELITKDPLLTDNLIRLYQGGLDPQHCAAVKRNGQVTLNPNCPVVHHQMCEASVRVERLYNDSGRAEQAADAKDYAANALACGSSE